MKRLMSALVLVAAVVAVLLLVGSEPAPGPRPGHVGAGGRGAKDRGAAGQTGATTRRPQATAALPEVPEGVSLAGQVVDEHGAAIAGALVCATCEPTDCPVAAERRTCAATSADGDFEVFPPRPGRYEVAASAPQHLPGRARRDGTTTFDLRDGGGAEDLEIVLRRGGARVRGLVRDRLGGVIVGALVTAGWGETHATTRSGPDGRFELTVPEGRAYVKARSPGYAAGGTLVSAPGEVVLELLPGGALMGRVVEADSLRPIPDVVVTVRATEAAGRRHGSTWHGRTDGEGHFVADGLAPGRYQADVHDRGWFGTSAGGVGVGLLETAPEIVVSVRPGARVTGRVVHADGGEPCPGAALDLRGTVTALREKVTADADGRAVFDGLPQDTYRLRVRCEATGARTEDLPVRVSGDETDERVWTLEAGYVIRGVVVDREGAPLAGTTVHGWPSGTGRHAFGTAGDDGRFLLDATEGTWRLVTGMMGDPDGDSAETVTLTETHRTAEVRLVVAGAGGVSGRVLDADGEPVSGVSVVLRADRRMTFVDTTGPDGRYSETHLDPGPVTVLAIPPWSSSHGPMSPEVVTKDVEIPEDGTVEVDLVLGPRDGELRGRVVDEASRPMRDVFVAAWRVREGQQPDVDRLRLRARSGAPPALTGDQGEFVLPSLPEGRYVLRAWRDGGVETVRQDVRTGDDVTVVLPAAAGLEGRLRRPDAPVPRVFRIQATSEAGEGRTEAFSDTGGRFSLDDLPPGRWTLVALAAEGTGRTEVTLRGGERRTGVEVTLAAPAVVRGRVVDAETLEPVKGVEVLLHRDGVVRGRRLQATTGADGLFRIGDVAAGRHQTMLHAPKPHASRPGPVLVVSGGETDLGDLALIRGDDLRSDLGIRPVWPPEGEAAEDLRIVVQQVRPDSPAARSGLAAGDVITAVRGQDVTGAAHHRFFALIRAESGETVPVGLANGRTVAITAE